MTKPIPRSRLHITYRTKIDGTPKQAKLPMRFLVLGDFTAHDRRGLGERPVHSIMPGMDLGSFMDELQLSSRIDDPGLQQVLPAGFSGTITGKWKSKPLTEENTAEGATGDGILKIAGKGSVAGDIRDNGFGSFTGEVEISGVLEGVPCTYDGDDWVLDEDKLFAELAADAEPAPGEGKNSRYEGIQLFGKVEPAQDTYVGSTGVTGNVETAKLNGNKTEYIPQALDGVTLAKLEGADDDTDPDPELVLGPTKVTSDGVKVHLTIPLRKVSNFKPVHVAAMVPQIRRLVLLRNLALETRNYLANYPVLRDRVKDVLKADKDKALEEREFQLLRAGLKQKYPQLLIAPSGPTTAADPPADPPADP